MFPKVPGTIVEITKDKGDPVAAGELLLRIDPKPYEDAVRQVEAQLNVAQVAASGAASTLSTIRPQLERLERLLGEGVVPQSQVDSVRTDVEAAGVGAGSARAQGQMGEVGLDIARDRLADTGGRAPFDGVVAERLADVGTIAQPMPPTPVLVILDISRVKVEGAVSELEFGRVDREGRVDVVLDAYPDGPVPARIAAVMPVLDPETRSVRFSVTLDNDGRFRPAMAATLRLPTLAETWTVVPREALLGDPASGSATLFVVDPRGAVEERRVSVLGRAEDRIRVDGVLPVSASRSPASSGCATASRFARRLRDPAPSATPIPASIAPAPSAPRQDAAP